MAVTIERTTPIIESRYRDIVTLTTTLRATSGATILAERPIAATHNMAAVGAENALRDKLKAQADRFYADAVNLEADLPKLAALTTLTDNYLGTLGG